MGNISIDWVKRCVFLKYKCRVFQTQCHLQMGKIAFELLQFPSLQRWKPGNRKLLVIHTGGLGDVSEAK